MIAARRDAEAVAGTLHRLVSDGALRTRLSRGGRALSPTATWPRIAAAHGDLYRQVLAGA